MKLYIELEPGETPEEVLEQIKKAFPTLSKISFGSEDDDNLNKMIRSDYPQLPELVVNKLADLLRAKEPLLEERIKKVCFAIKLSEEQSDVLADFGAEVASGQLTYLEALLIAALIPLPPVDL